MSVDIYWDWKATPNKENREVEVSLKSNGKVTDRKKTKNREVTFLNLESGKKYIVLVENKEVGEFIFGIENSKDIYDVQVTDFGGDYTSKMITWKDIKGTMKIQLKKGSKTEREVITSENKVVFAQLPIGVYQIYMNGQKQSLEIIVQNDNSDLTVPVTKLVLVDVPSSHWARNMIDRLVTKGIIKGFQGGTFKPESLVTREQFVTMLVQAKNLEGFEVKTIFTDVPEGHWSARYVSAAVSSGKLIPREYGGHFTDTGNNIIDSILGKIYLFAITRFNYPPS
ncbi:hypothetical protein C4A76_18295 [Brevibacillus laterosporus]|nr:hypothetical protein C4A76_18295 [Brevibacillus laterosporus]